MKKLIYILAFLIAGTVSAQTIIINGESYGGGSGGGSGASELIDLTDVNSSTPTNRNVLIADGTDFESRALLEADISDLGDYVLNSNIGTTVQGFSSILENTTASFLTADETKLDNLTLTGAVDLDAIDTTVGFISVTAPIDLDVVDSKLGTIEEGAEVNTVNSITSGEPTGFIAISNIGLITQSELDAGTPVEGTGYLIYVAE